VVALAGKSGVTFEQAFASRRDANPTRRYGTIEEFGAACAFLCSARASYIVAQNLLIDGGAYPGTL
jgi:3-oxoacyl-[acyl-carrier protein] reductase